MTSADSAEVPATPQASTPETVTPSRYRERIVSIYEQISALASLAPSAVLDPLCAELMALCLVPPTPALQAVLAEEATARILPHLREINARAEYFREGVWARRILASRDPYRTLQDAPFFDNYVNLTRYELHGVLSIGRPRPERVLMVGCGPMPVSAILTSRLLEAPVDCVDVDPVACELAQSLCDSLSPPGVACAVYQSDVVDFTPPVEYDVIVVATGVGLRTAERLRALRHLAASTRSGDVVIIRSVHPMRTLLFPTIDMAELPSLVPQLLIQPFNKVVNSVLVATRR